MASLTNPDLAPTTVAQRTWSVWNIAALWVGMAVCIPTYMLGSGLVAGGMGWRAALFTITLANLIVLVPMMLNGHAGAKYGVPFPVLLRASFGVYGANIAALMRGLVACGWFGIQTYLGGSAVYILLAVLFGFERAAPADHIAFIGLSPGQLACFLGFWAVQIGIILRGVDSIKWLEAFAAPILLLVGAGLVVWALRAPGGWSRITSPETVAAIAEGAPAKPFWALFPAALTGMIGFWSTLALNIPDFTRFARSQRDQALGQLVGLPTTMGFYAFIGVVVTLATVVYYGEPIPDPIALIGRFESPLVVVGALLAISIATISTNLAANVVSPANDFSNLWPRRIGFRLGGVITGLIGILIMPWKLLATFGDYLFTWLVGYSALLGPIAGIMICDYCLLRRRRLSVADLYDANGRYRYRAGFNPRALVALALGVAPSAPGFIHSVTGRTHGAHRDAIGQIDAALARGMSEAQIDAATRLGELPAVRIPIFPEIFESVYTYAWFVGLSVALVAYAMMMSRDPSVARDLAEAR